MTIHEIRRKNLKLLIDRHFEGNKRQFALKVGVAVNTVSRVFSDTPGNQRNVGSPLARKVEAYFGLEEGSLDSVESEFIREEDAEIDRDLIILALKSLLRDRINSHRTASAVAEMKNLSTPDERMFGVDEVRRALVKMGSVAAAY